MMLKDQPAEEINHQIMDRRKFLLAGSAAAVLTPSTPALSNPLIARVMIWLLGTVAAWHIGKELDRWKDDGYEPVKKESINKVIVKIEPVMSYNQYPDLKNIYYSAFAEVNIENKENSILSTSRKQKFTLYHGPEILIPFYINDLVSPGPLSIFPACHNPEGAIDFKLDPLGQIKLLAI